MTTIATETQKAIAAHPRAIEIACLVLDCLLEAPTGMPAPAMVQERANRISLPPGDATIGTVRVIDALTSSAPSVSDANILGALVAHALSLAPPVDAAHTARSLVRLATHTPIDALGMIDAAMGENASPLWDAIAIMVRQHDTDGTGLRRPEAIVAASALAASDNAKAASSRDYLATVCQDPTIVRLLAGAPSTGRNEEMLVGELAPAPRGAVCTFLLGLCGWLLLSNALRLVARVVLRMRRPTEVSFTPRGIRVRTSTRMLGKVLREKEAVVPLDGLKRVAREVRYGQPGVYAGLVALAVGSYVGFAWFLDGLRAASLPLATAGLLIVLGGVALDFALVSLVPTRKGKCRVIITPVRGAATCVAGVDAALADGLLRKIARRS